MSDRHGTPINMITVLCDARRVQNIGITCKCGNRWTERIPAELHESSMICRFACIKCGTVYHLANKQLHRADSEKGETNDQHKQQFAKIAVGNDYNA